MVSRYRSRRSVKRLARKSRRNFITTLVVISILIYATLTWVLPFFINSVGFVKNTVKPSKKAAIQVSENASLAPPVFNIPFEATNTAQVNIKGFTTPNSRVKLYIDDEPKETIDVSSDGSFDFQDVSLSIGTNNIYGRTLDDKNKESLPSKTIKLIYDSEEPLLKVFEPEDGKKIQGGDKKARVSGNTENEAKILVNGTQIVVGKDGNFATNMDLNEGDNTIVIKAIDIANNVTEEQRQVNYTP